MCFTRCMFYTATQLQLYMASSYILFIVISTVCMYIFVFSCYLRSCNFIVEQIHAIYTARC